MFVNPAKELTSEIRNFKIGTNVSKCCEPRPISSNYESKCPKQSNQPSYWQIIGLWIFGESCKRADWCLLQKYSSLRPSPQHTKKIVLRYCTWFSALEKRSLRSELIYSRVSTKSPWWLIMWSDEPILSPLPSPIQNMCKILNCFNWRQLERRQFFNLIKSYEWLS